MTRYHNGYVPRNALICIATGTNSVGYWEHLLSPSQKYKHDALVARAKARTKGRILRITTGYCAYRPYAAQVQAKRKYGPDAAAPGYSSHGGTYNGRDAMAMDYGNWPSVYNGFGGQTAFYEDCRAVGLTPGVIARETWHVIDYDPWAAVPSGGQGTSAQPSEEDDMYDDGKHREVLTAARPVKLYKMGSGIIAVGDEGGFWVIPSEAYLNLLIAWEIAGPNLVNRPIDQNELTAMRGILGATSNSATAARVEAVLNLTPEDAERLAAAVGRQPVVLSEETLGEIARAAAEGAREGGADGAAAAISSLSFVTTIAA
ncbi:MAG: hypothetical protein BGN97_03770 [Microbacterium sp. 69-10]|uniref:hypothetical protein n=1 Tax=Microbacterium sp. 69-10 TaxID=1895783 RepID=UPI0009648406|nr:hypothetical protein [Microbacterium sp. 69-10]OJU41829.1 MAG: hypothetical protein BGN97_03770 [Microbacterium sp. 69-10]